MITLSNYKDIGGAEQYIQDLVTQYYKHLENAETDDAYELLSSNKQYLLPYLFTNESANKVEREIYNIAKDILLKQKIIISDTCPLEPLATGSEWIQPY